MSNSEQKIQQSTAAEEQFIKYMDKQKIHFYDVRKVAIYMQQDIDFILHMNEDTHLTVDVKSDSYMQGQFATLFLETKTRHQYGTDVLLPYHRDGCYIRTKAQYWVYYGINNQLQIQQGWKINLDKLRQYVNSHYLKEIPTEGGINYGYSVPIKELVELKIIEEIELIK